MSTLPLPSFPLPTFLNTTSFCARSPLPHFLILIVGPRVPTLTSKHDLPSRRPLENRYTIPSLSPPYRWKSRLSSLNFPPDCRRPRAPSRRFSPHYTGEHLHSLYRRADASPSTLHLASIKRSHSICPQNLSTEIHNLSSRIANLDISPQPPNLAPLQESLRDIASRLPSAAQAPFPPQRPGIPQQATPSSSGSRPTPTSNTNPARQEKGKERAPPAQPPPPPNTVWPSPAADPDLPRYDMSTSPPTLYGNPEAFAKK